MTAFDLEKTYLGLNGKGRVTAIPGGAEFWRTIETNPDAGGTLVTVGATANGDWRHWEIHPKGDEVLVVLEGTGRMIFEREGANEEHDLKPGALLVVPKNTWHTAKDQRGLKILFMTYGEGTAHKPL